MMTDNVWIWLAGQFIVAAAIWGGIRADIKAIHEKAERAQKTADDAHQRIDHHLEQVKMR